MKKELAREIIACLPHERTLYHYHKNRYAVELLRWYLSGKRDVRIASLRASPYARLLDKPLVRSVLAKLGRGIANANDLDSLWEDRYETYVLTLGTWGTGKRARWKQLSRPGGNLVLQLNFSNRHDTALSKCGIDFPGYFNGWGHPVSRRRCTLAWSRIDLDFDTGEALIEEIQSDWVRDIDELRRDVREALKQGERKLAYWGDNVYVDRVHDYLTTELSRHSAIWSEAMLSATLHFLIEELGMERIYYHSFDTGAKLKHIKSRKPPRSLYTQLPNQFCFERSNEAPEFLANDKYARRALKKIQNPQWFRMSA